MREECYKVNGHNAARDIKRMSHTIYFYEAVMSDLQVHKRKNKAQMTYRGHTDTTGVCGLRYATWDSH